MPNLEEYKAKRILSGFGIQVPKGEAAASFAALEASVLDGTDNFVLKSQVTVASRGKKGGIVFAGRSSLEEAFERLLSTSIDDIFPGRILVEEKVPSRNKHHAPRHRNPQTRSGQYPEEYPRHYLPGQD